MQEILSDPEVMRVLQDHQIQKLLTMMKTNPDAAQLYVKNLLLPYCKLPFITPPSYRICCSRTCLASLQLTVAFQLFVGQVI